MDFSAVKEMFSRAATAQVRATAAWHDAPPAPLGSAPRDFDELALAEHQANFELWHVEDEARRTDVDDALIARCKREIDALNQQRNDLIERLDETLVALVVPLLPADAPARHNTETLGSVLDRLSILALKLFHMQEQVEREDASAAHREACAQKAAVLSEQRADLLASALELIDEYAAGAKRPKVYFQFKMYNDPALNPALYAPGRDASKG